MALDPPDLLSVLLSSVAFRIYDVDKDGFISNGELFQVLKMMAGSNLKDWELQQVVDKTIIGADQDGDGRLCFQEFSQVRSTWWRLRLRGALLATPTSVR